MVKFDVIAKDIIEKDKFKSLKQDPHHGLTRYDHVIRVAKNTYRLSRILKMDYVSATRGALLHDYFNVLLYNSGLTEREIFVLVKRFGLENNKKLTLVELSELCNLTHERVRQIEKEALEKLRHSKHLKYVENYYSGSNEVTKKKKWM